VTAGGRRGGCAWVVAAAAVAASLGGCGGDKASVETDNLCGFRDGEPNNEPGRATAYEIGASFDGCMEPGDIDHLRVAAPADGTAGYVQLMVADAAGAIRLTIYDASGSHELGSFAGDGAGLGGTFFWAVDAGQESHVSIRDDAGTATAYAYRVTSTYAPVADAFEPNDSMDVAAAMSLGIPMQAFIFAGEQGAADNPAAYDDFYRFSAAAEIATIKLDDVPADLAAKVFLLRADGSEVARVSSGQRGGALSLVTPMPLGQADHFIRVALWADPPASIGAGTSLPAHFTQPYTLSVMQP